MYGHCFYLLFQPEGKICLENKDDPESDDLVEKTCGLKGLGLPKGQNCEGKTKDDLEEGFDAMDFCKKEVRMRKFCFI